MAPSSPSQSSDDESSPHVLSELFKAVETDKKKLRDEVAKLNQENEALKAGNPVFDALEVIQALQRSEQAGSDKAEKAQMKRRITRLERKKSDLKKEVRKWKRQVDELRAQLWESRELVASMEAIQRARELTRLIDKLDLDRFVEVARLIGGLDLDRFMEVADEVKDMAAEWEDLAPGEVLDREA